MDPILQSFLNATDKTERERLRNEIILTYAIPQIRKVLRLKLGFYVGQSGTNPSTPNAEDLFNNIIIKLIQRLNHLASTPDKNTIDNFKQFAATVATNACHDYLKTKSPARARLKNNLRDLISRHQDFKIWKHKHSAALCGFAVWDGYSISPTSVERLKQFKENPELFSEKIFGDTDPQSLTPGKIVANIFRWLNGPIELDSLVEIYARLTGTNIQPPVSIDQSDAYLNRSLTDSAIPSDRRIENREKLILLWNEIKRLSPMQRDAVCLGVDDEERENILFLLVHEDIVTFPQLASDLGMSLKELLRLWKQLPMDRSSLADYLGTTRGKVSKLLCRARNNLKKRLASQL